MIVIAFSEWVINLQKCDYTFYTHRVDLDLHLSLLSKSIFYTKILYQYIQPHQWWSDPALKASRLEVQGSIPGRACRLRCSEFSVFFSKLA